MKVQCYDLKHFRLTHIVWQDFGILSILQLLQGISRQVACKPTHSLLVSVASFICRPAMCSRYMCQNYFGAIVNLILKRLRQQLMIVISTVIISIMMIVKTNTYMLIAFLSLTRNWFLCAGASCAPIKLKRCAFLRHSTSIRR